MSRGPTRRLKAVIALGAVTERELIAAGVEADLLEHPYVGVEHVELARLRAADKIAEYQALRTTLTPGVASNRWRPRGPRSALRRAGLRSTRQARLDAEARRDATPGSTAP